MVRKELFQNDTRPNYIFTAKDKDGNAINITSWTVVFRMATSPGAASPKVQRDCALTDPVNGKCKFTWETGDTDTTGLYIAEVEYTEPGGGIVTANHFEILIKDDLPPTP